MSPFRPKQDPLSKRKDTAAEWIIRQDHGLTAEQQDAFNDWLTQNPQHRKAYSQLHFCWEELDRLAGLQSSNRTPVNPDLLDNWIPVQRQINRWVVWGGVLPIAALLILTFVVFFNSTIQEEAKSEVTQQQVTFERIRRQPLQDGSELFLNRGADAHVEYTDSARVVRLLTGEVNFVVAKDPSRPFWVEAKGVRLKAVGTAFSVRISKDELNVIVAEGTVAVQTGFHEEEPESHLEANQRAVLSFNAAGTGLEIEELAENTLEDELLWVPKLIDFEDVPLRVIVDEFNRRNPVHSVIRDRELQELRLSSVFWSDNVAGFVRLLEVKFGIKAFVGGDGTVHLMLPQELR